jgi:hypothetical protein
MPYINQIHLEEKGVEKNKDFLVRVYTNEELKGVTSFIDKLDCSESWARQEDPSMTLERFIELVDDKTHFLLQINSPTPDEIRYAAVLWYSGIRRHAFVECPFTQWNFDVVSRLYLQSFGVRLVDEPVPEGLEEYYEWRKANYRI